MKASELLFLQPFQPLTDYSDENREALLEIAKNHLLDLSSPPESYFSLETQVALTQHAANRLKKSIDTRKDIKNEWRAIVITFHREQQWGLTAELRQPAKLPPTPEQKVSRELFPYVWVLVQAVVIMKAAVYYFGMQSSNEPSTRNSLFFAIVLTLSFGSLFSFAWRKSRK